MVWLKSSFDSHASSSLLLKELIKGEQSPPPLILNELAGIIPTFTKGCLKGQATSESISVSIMQTIDLGNR